MRERRRAETTRRLISEARRLTSEVGLAGFTVDELCADAGVSRRTFFNYFASKDDAVLGVPLERDPSEHVREFLARGAAESGMSADLLSDLARLAGARWRVFDLNGESAADLARAVEKEPRLLRRMLDLGSEAERSDAQLIAQRENLPPGDQRGRVAAQIMGALVRSAAVEFLQAGNTLSFHEILEHRIRTARMLFLGSSSTEGRE